MRTITTSSLLALIVTTIMSTGISSNTYAASCCGGGSASSLLLPKFARAMIDVSVDYEHYDGFWNNTGKVSMDPQGADLNQLRFNLAYAHRLASRWQASISAPYVWNQNQYATLQRNTNGIGDSSVSLWYEAFDKPNCVWQVTQWQDLLPAIYWGTTLTIPTGTSPYDNISDNFDITGRGAYRLDAAVLIDKTIYPWNASLSARYGQHIKRPVNREYGTYIEPYAKQLGDRFNSTAAVGYTYFTDKMASLTTTLAYTYLEEGKTKIDDLIDPTSGLRKQSIAATLAWATENRDWISKITWSHAPARNNWGENFPITDIITVGLSHVIP